MLQEFRKFVARGNVVDLAVGIAVGTAFTAVVNSLVEDVLMPPIGLITGGIDFSKLYLELKGTNFSSPEEAFASGEPIIRYGEFLNAVIAFVIVAFAVFLLVKGYNRLRERRERVPPAPTEKECPFCRYRIPRAAVRCGHCTSALDAA